MREKVVILIIFFLLLIHIPISLHHSYLIFFLSILPDIYMRLHFPFSIQGLFFLSGAWISGSVFSFSSMYSFMLKLEGELTSEDGRLHDCSDTYVQFLSLSPSLSPSRTCTHR